MVQSTEKRLQGVGEKHLKPKQCLLWLDNPHASEEERAKLIQQAIADRRMQEIDDVTFVSWMKCLAEDCRVCWGDQAGSSTNK
jgi:hypothetical protein